MDEIERESINFSINDSNIENFLNHFKFPKNAKLDISACDYDLDNNKYLKKLYKKRYI